MIQTGCLASDSLLIKHCNNGNMLQNNTQYGVDPYCCIPIVQLVSLLDFMIDFVFALQCSEGTFTE